MRVRLARNRDRSRLTGSLLAIAGLQWFFCVLIAEGLHPGFTLSAGEWIPYSGQVHFISELGVGSTALLFSISTILMGLAVIFASVLFYLQRNARVLAVCLLLSGIGGVGVGVFSTEVQPTHGIFQTLALIFGALAAVFSFRKADAPMSFVSVLLGVISLASTGVFFRYLGLGVNDMSTFIGLRKGAMERLVIYPIILWLVGYGYQRVRAVPSPPAVDR